MSRTEKRRPTWLISDDEWRLLTFGTKRRVFAYLVQVVVVFALAVVLRHSLWAWAAVGAVMAADYAWSCWAASRRGLP